MKKAIIERSNAKISIHGVLLESFGAGVLITGTSGIGKTTSALNFIADGHYWVADDLVVITKSMKKGLIARGHTRIRNLLHTEKTGIIPIRKIIDGEKIKRKTILRAIIDVQRANKVRHSFTAGTKNILGMELPLIRVGIPSDGHLNVNLLNKAVQKLHEMN